MNHGEGNAPRERSRVELKYGMQNDRGQFGSVLKKRIEIDAGEIEIGRGSKREDREEGERGYEQAVRRRRYSRKRTGDREIGGQIDEEHEREMGARGGCARSRGIGFSARGVSHPALTSGYAHPKDGRPSIDQLDLAR